MTPLTARARTVFNAPAPGEIQLQILSFVPGDFFSLKSVSRALEQIALDFLEWNKQEIFLVASRPDVHPLLHRCLYLNYTNYSMRLSPLPGYNDFKFHVSLQRDVLALGAPLEDCSGPLLSAGKVFLFNEQVQPIQDASLQSVWGPLHQTIEEAGRPMEGVPEKAASAQEIRTWMHAHPNVLQEIPKLDLNHLYLTCLPEELGLCTGLRTLNLSYNLLASLPKTLLDKLVRLETLSLAYNRLFSLPEDIFHGLTSLQRLSIAYNQLAFLPRGLFRELDHLQDLVLSNNRLVSLPEDLFHGLVRLRTLHMEHNQLGSLPERLFQGLGQLELLEFEYNQLLFLPEELFSGLGKLRELHFSCNRLTTLPRGLFRALIRLERLGLSNNRLLSLPKGLLEGQPRLQKLYLYANPRLLFSFKEQPFYGNNLPLRAEMREFFSETCRSPFAAFYQLAAGASSPEVVRGAFAGLDNRIKNAIYRKIGEKAGPLALEWGALHAWDDIQNFYDALKGVVKESFERCRGAPYSGSNILRQIDAMLQ